MDCYQSRSALAMPFAVAAWAICMAISSATVADDAVAVLPFDEGSGNTATDMSGNGRAGLLVNGPEFEVDTPDGSAHALRFDGADDYVDLGAFDVTGDELTLVAWFKAEAFPSGWRDGRLVSKAIGTAEAAHYFMLSTVADGAQRTRLRGRVRANGTTHTVIAQAGDLTTGVWYHAALTYDGQALRLYLDGKQVGSSSLRGAIDRASHVPVTIGAQPPGAGGKHFDGLIDDVRIYERALDGDEIAALFGDPLRPRAIADEYTVQGQMLQVDARTGVLSNDTDANGDGLTAMLEESPSHGALTFDSDGSFTYTPDRGYAGTDRFTYRAHDGYAYSTAATVSLTVSSDTAPDPTNTPPIIEGSPPTTAMSGQTYRFMPTASDADGDGLTFTIANPPRWTSFDPSNGELAGVPTPGDVATYQGIVIGVTDGAHVAELPAFSIEVRATSQGTATVSWQAPSERTDGSALLDLTGFKVYWGTASGSYTSSVTIDNPGTTRYVVENLSPGTYYFSVKAYDSDGGESGYSREASKIVQD